MTAYVLGPWEIAAILAVVVLLFGAAKLPELARSTGRSLRIFKAETKGLLDDDTSGEARPELRGSQDDAGDGVSSERRDGTTP